MNRISRLTNACQTIARRQQQPVAQPAAFLPQLQRAPDDHRHEVLRDDVRVTVGLGDHGRRERAEHAPTQAAGRARWSVAGQDEVPGSRRSPRSAPVRKTLNIACGPIAAVTGASGIEMPSTDVFAIMLTPSGAFICAEKNGLTPSVTTRAPCASIHSNKRLVLAVEHAGLRTGRRQSRAVSQRAPRRRSSAGRAGRPRSTRRWCGRRRRRPARRGAGRRGAGLAATPSRSA